MLDQEASLPQRRSRLSMYDAFTDYVYVMEHLTDDNVHDYLHTYGHIWEGCKGCYNSSFYNISKHLKEDLIHR